MSKEYRALVLKCVLKCVHLYAGFVLIVPNLDGSIIRAGDEIRFLTTRVIFQTVDAFCVTFEGKVGLRGSQLPHFDEPIERCRGKGVVVFGIEHDLRGTQVTAILSKGK